MDTLHDTVWDVIIAGTGLHESLLALALSRTGKKILHVDKDDYYGSSEAAMSLQELKDWATNYHDNASNYIFSAASVSMPDAPDAASGLSFPRAYSLALAPQLLYARSPLLPTLVSSRVDTQLEFLAMGSWWVFDDPDTGSLKRVPNGREELFASQDITASAKRSLMKFLRFVADPEAQEEMLATHASLPFDAFLQSNFGIPPAVQQPIHALVMSSAAPRHTQTSFAVSRITTHLRSIGVFGPGFGAVIPKWGGLAEIAQVGCRAGAVGGGVYVLNNGIASISTSTSTSASASATRQEDDSSLDVTLAQGEAVKTAWIAGSLNNIPHASVAEQIAPFGSTDITVSRSISVISSSLAHLFPPPSEGAPPHAGAVVIFPGATVAADDLDELDEGNDASALPPVYIIVHSSDTGECPNGQSILYASTALPCTAGFPALDRAITRLLQTAPANSDEARPAVLFRAQYQQRGQPEQQTNGTSPDADAVAASGRVLGFPPLGTDLVFDEDVLARVQHAWRCIVGEGVSEGEFMNFPARNAEEDDDDTGV